MAISGFYVALLLIGAVPVMLFGTSSAGAFAMLGVVVAVWLALGLFDWLLATPPRRMRVERELPERARLGEPVTSTLLLTNLASRALNGQVRDGWEPSAGAARMRERVRIPAGERRAVTVTLHPWRRGDRRSAFVVVRSWGPLRLTARQAQLVTSGRVRILPPFHARKHLPSRVARLRELDGQTTLQVRGQGTEFDSLREYVRGDDARSIDWRATARRQELVVRTWRPERDRRVVIVIDTGRTAAARIADETRLDTAIESALLLTALATRAGDRVDLVAFDQRVRARVQGASGPTVLAKIVDAMANVDPELLEVNWPQVPKLVSEITTRRAFVVLLSTTESAGAARTLLESMPELARKHFVLVASVTDPAVASAAAQLGSREQVFRAAAAERALLDAQRVRRALGQLGVDTVSATPYDLPPRLADRYLELKRAGKL